MDQPPIKKKTEINDLPIGQILSRLDSCKDVIRSSATCKKWCDARHNHLPSLCFNHDFLPRRPTRELEVIITKIVLRTTGLQSLSILLGFDRSLSAEAVISYIHHTRNTLQNFEFHATTSPSINILEICDWPKLEGLSLAYNCVVPIDVSFSALKSLSLSYISISSLNFSLLVTMCPKLETLSLFALTITADSYEHATAKLSSASLKYISIEHVNLENFRFDKFILEAPSIETLHLVDCTLKNFKLVAKGSLKVLEFKDVSVLNLDISACTSNLEVVDVSYTKNPDAHNYTITWPKLYHAVSGSLNLRKLRLWDIVFGDENDVVNLDNIATSFPQLNQLSMMYGSRDIRLHYKIQGSSDLENVTVLEVGWTVINSFFTNWVEGLLQRCPRLKKLVICGIISVAGVPGDMLVLSDFSMAMVGLLRKYTGVDVVYKYRQP